MDLAKLESDFKAAMLPEFDNSRIEFIYGKIFFIVEKLGCVSQYNCNIKNIECDIAIIGYNHFFSEMKNLFIRHIEKYKPYPTAIIPCPNLEKFKSGGFITKQQPSLSDPMYNENHIENIRKRR